MIAYDCGMHNGDDCSYYLSKGYDVVAIEANPKLCRDAEVRFKSEIDHGKLKVLNVALAASTGMTSFFVHTVHSVLSTLEPRSTAGGEWVALDVKTERLTSIIADYGSPSLIKIDIEGYDQIVLRDLKRNNILSPLISVEAHRIEILCELIAMDYSQFKILPCAKVGLDPKYTDVDILRVDNTSVPFVFNEHSSGPFGDDAPGDWMFAEEAIQHWLMRERHFGSGWFDVHARV